MEEEPRRLRSTWIPRSRRPILPTVDYPKGPWPPGEELPRMPLHDPARCDSSGECARACPNGALQVEGTGADFQMSLDYGKCLFCRLCVDACPSGAMRAGPMGELAVRHREDLQLFHGASGPRPERLLVEVGERVGRLFSGSLAIRAVDAGSCNGCEVEVAALLWPRYDLERLGISFVASPRHADALLVTGPVTRNMKLALQKTYLAVPSPSFVLAVGACGISGGPFLGSGEVEGGVDRVLPVEVYIPGCPPAPLALLYGIWLGLGQVDQRLHEGALPSGRPDNSGPGDSVLTRDPPGPPRD